MLELIFDPNLRVLPTAKCSKHLSENIGAVSAWIEGRVTVEWKCPVCESEAMMEQTGESGPRATAGSSSDRSLPDRIEAENRPPE